MGVGWPAGARWLEITLWVRGVTFLVVPAGPADHFIRPRNAPVILTRPRPARLRRGYLLWTSTRSAPTKKVWVSSTSRLKTTSAPAAILSRAIGEPEPLSLALCVHLVRQAEPGRPSNPKGARRARITRTRSGRWKIPLNPPFQRGRFATHHQRKWLYRPESPDHRSPLCGHLRLSADKSTGEPEHPICGRQRISAEGLRCRCQIWRSHSHVGCLVRRSRNASTGSGRVPAGGYWSSGGRNSGP